MDENKVVALNPFIILLIILIEGFVTIAVEMITIRQLITVVGNSVVITSLIIGIFLLFLAIGYYRGGQYTENYHRILKNNFIWASLLLGVGLSYLFIQIVFLKIFQVITDNSLLGLTLYLLLITAPLVYLLGQTVPITTNLFKYEYHVGSISGKVLFISTIGSFLGSVFTTLVLMNFLGVAWTVLINFLLLYFLILLLINYRQDYIQLILLSLAGLIIFYINIAVENKLFVKTNNYGDYQIVKNFYHPPYVGNLLNINNSASSFLTQDNKAFEYIEVIKRILFQELQLRNKDILVLGAGGFTLSAESNFNNRFLYVDIDGDIPEIVKKGFINTINGQFVAEDARKFLMYNRKKFAAVISDVYTSHYTIPFHLLTKEYFESIKRTLAPNGVAIFNIIANPTLKDRYSKRVDNTIRSVFNNCMSIPLPYHDGPANIIYICTPLDHVDHTIYNDNLNGSMLDFFYVNKRDFDGN